MYSISSSLPDFTNAGSNCSPDMSSQSVVRCFFLFSQNEAKHYCTIFIHNFTRFLGTNLALNYGLYKFISTFTICFLRFFYSLSVCTKIFSIWMHNQDKEDMYIQMCPAAMKTWVFLTLLNRSDISNVVLLLLPIFHWSGSKDMDSGSFRCITWQFTTICTHI